MKYTDCLIYHTKNYAHIARGITAAVEDVIASGSIEIKTFKDGEIYHKIQDDVEDKDVLIVGGTINDAETLELFDIACHVVTHGAKSLTLIVPYFGYSTMERAVNEGEIVKSKTRAILLSAIPRASTRTRIVFVDLHSEGIPHYFEGGIQPKHIYAKPIIKEAFQEIQKIWYGNNVVIASTDAGRAKWVESLAKDLHVECAIITKRRLSGTKTEVAGVNADVKDAIVVIYDDMIRTGGTLIEAAKTYLQAGAKKIYVIATHAVMPEGTVKKLFDANIFEKIIVTDTHPQAFDYPGNFSAGKNPFITVKPISGIIAQKLFTLDETE